MFSLWSFYYSLPIRLLWKLAPVNIPDQRSKHPSQGTCHPVGLPSSPCSAPFPPPHLCAGFSTHADSCHHNRWALVKVTGPGLHLLAAVFCHSWQNYSWTQGRRTAARTRPGVHGGEFWGCMHTVDMQAQPQEGHAIFTMLASYKNSRSITWKKRK